MNRWSNFTKEELEELHVGLTSSRNEMQDNDIDLTHKLLLELVDSLKREESE